MPYNVLCVDPDPSAREKTVAHLRDGIAETDIVVETAETLAEAQASVGTETDVVVTEYSLPDGTGFDLIETAEQQAPDAGCILYTETDPDSIDTTEIQGAITEYVGKDSVFGTERLTKLVRTTVETRAQGSYPLPQNETERLAALQSYNLDNQGLSDSLETITDLAADHFGVDISSINIINEHSQDFLACHGRTNDWEAMDREDSICTFTILEDDVMVVEDVTEDPRFESRSEKLLDLGIRSYMGANIVTPSGLVIGPLCIYDDQPRSFSAADRAYLRDLASLAMDLIETHSRLDATRAVEQ